MNRIDQLFTQKKSEVLSIYFTAGYPGTDSTTTIISALEKNGADMIEIGVPFSDPVADGPVIQQSSHQALQNGMTVGRLLDQLADIRRTVKIPLIMMGYLNPLLKFGIDKLCTRLQDIGIDGLIIPDLPPGEYEKKYQPIFRSSGLHHILLVTPQTTEERIRYLDRLSSGFLYMVSTSSTTGGKLDFHSVQKKEYFEWLSGMHLSNPLMAGFGISGRESLQEIFRYVAGGIIGTAFIQALEGNKGTLEEKVEGFMKGLK